MRFSWYTEVLQGFDSHGNKLVDAEQVMDAVHDLFL